MSTIFNPTGGPAPGKGGNRGGDGNNGGNPKGPHYTPWLVVRYHVGDGGNRPLLPGTVFWESTDVWSKGSMGINQPVVGEPTQVWALVTNVGLSDATNATIQFYWANPSIAITEASVTPIGPTTWLTGQTIPAKNSVPFQNPTDWTPMEANNGHECLIVQAFDPLFDPLHVPMQPFYDRHVGQKNEQLVALAPGMMFRFPLEARNFTNEDREIAVEVRPGLIPRNFVKRFGRPGILPAELLDAAFPLPVDIDIDTKAIGAREVQTFAMPKAPAIDCLGPAQVSRRQIFNAGEVRQVVISGKLPPSAVPGEIYVVRITQTMGQVVVGGYTLYVTLDTGKRILK